MHGSNAVSGHHQVAGLDHHAGRHEIRVNLAITNLHFGEFADDAKENPEGIFFIAALCVAIVDREKIIAANLPSGDARRSFSLQ
ncbi:hypothetical protein ACWIG3_16430 [Streptomyces celluloflavus]